MNKTLCRSHRCQHCWASGALPAFSGRELPEDEILKKPGNRG